MEKTFRASKKYNYLFACVLILFSAIQNFQNIRQEREPVVRPSVDKKGQNADWSQEVTQMGHFSM